MISPSEAEEGVVKHLISGAKKLGYKPFNNITFISEGPNGEGKLTGICPLCGRQKTFESLDEIDSVKEIKNPNTKESYYVNSCDACAISRKEQVSGDPKRPLNGLLYKRAVNVLESKFNSKLIPVKANLFVDPNEYVTFRPNTDGAKKYKIKLKVIMIYSDTYFEDLDREDTDESVFEIAEDDLRAILKENETVTVPFEDFLVNKERDSLEFIEREEDTDEPAAEETTEEPEVQEEVVETSEPVVEEPVAEETETPTSEETSTEDVAAETEVVTTEPETRNETSDSVDEVANGAEPDEEDIATKEDETEITDSDIQDDEFTGTSEEVTVKSDSDTEHVVQDTNEEPVVEETIKTSDETEITDSDLQDNEFGGSSEEVTIDSVSTNANKETTTESAEETSTEDNGEITLELDDSESSFDFFGNLFGKKKEESVTEETPKVTEETSTENNGEITLELNDEEVENPFSVASGERSETDENNVVSPITSEARKPMESEEQKEELELESVNENADEEEEITLELDGVTSKTEKKEENVSTETDVNHKDYIKDEAKKVYETDKKWYNNPVVFSENENENFNELMDEQDLIKEFQESDLGKVIYEVVKRTGVKASFTISEDTFEIPVVDFESGMRIICIDCNKVGQMKVQLAIMERQVEFAYPIPKGTKYGLAYLYSDCLTTKERTKATIKNLIKIVNKEKFDGRRIINLAGNYTLFYTDSIPVIRAFEAENSSYPQGKPCTKEIGIIALRHRSGKHEEFTAKDFMNYLNKNYKMDMKNHNLYMVATARYIVKPEPISKTVKYQITDYTELADSILKDGFDHIIGAIIKEHKLNNTVRDPKYLGTDFSQYKYQFEFEFDPSTLPSPSLEIWWDNENFWKTFDSFEDGQGKCYIRVPEYRTNSTDGYRKDPRLFLPIPFSKLFRADIEKAGVDVLSDNSRRKFIEQLGFVESYYPRMKRLMLNPLKTMKLEFSSSIFAMSKVDLNKFFSGNGVYDGGYDNILFQKLINSSKLDEKTKNMMSVLAISKMLKK
jgi:hypothetical protein